MNAIIRRRKGKPFHPVHDRMARDLLRNAQVMAVEIDDPMALDPGDKIVVLQSTRDDPLAEMKARKFIDDCDYEAGRHWQHAYENAEIGSVRGIDPTKEAVDGGRMSEVLTDRQIQAVKDLTEARKELGHAGNWLIVQVLGTRMTLMEVAIGRAGSKECEFEYKYVRKRFKECLTTLSVLFGFAMPTRS